MRHPPYHVFPSHSRVMKLGGADRSSGTLPVSLEEAKRAKMLSENQVDNLVSIEGEVYAQKTAVKAVRLTRQVKFDAGDGSILVAEPGDYLIQNVIGDKYTWALPGAYFEANYRKNGLE